MVFSDGPTNACYRYAANLDLPIEAQGNAGPTRSDVDTAYNSIRNLADSLTQVQQSISGISVTTDSPTFATPEAVNMIIARANYNSVVVTLPANLAAWGDRVITYKALVVATGYTLTLEVPSGADYFIDEIFVDINLKAYQSVTLAVAEGSPNFVAIRSSHLFDFDSVDPPLTFEPEVRP